MNSIFTFSDGLCLGFLLGLIVVFIWVGVDCYSYRKLKHENESLKLKLFVREELK